MAERVKKNGWSCAECIHCVKENPSISGVMAHYKCTSQKQRGFVMGWVQAKSQAGLKTMGGSCCNRLYPGDVILVFSRFNKSKVKYLYCGKVEIEGKTKLLLYAKREEPVNATGYIEVSPDWLRGQTGEFRKGIKILKQNPVQLEASKRMARKRKEKWLEKHG